MIDLELLYKNPLTLQAMIAQKEGFFKELDVPVNIKLIDYLPGFDMTHVTANVGDTTKVVEALKSGNDIVITSTLTRTMKIILKRNISPTKKLKLIASSNQSLGIYVERKMKELGLSYESITCKEMKERQKMLDNLEVDGACMIDPFLLRHIGTNYELIQEGKDTSYNYTCWAFKGEYARENPIQVIKFHKALNKATDFYNNMKVSDKFTYASSLLDIDKSLKDFYENLTFVEDTEYSILDLMYVYQWKVEKENYLNFEIDPHKVIFKWKK